MQIYVHVWIRQMVYIIIQFCLCLHNKVESEGDTVFLLSIP